MMKRTNNETVSPALGVASILGLSVLATVGVRTTNKVIDKTGEIYDSLSASMNPPNVNVTIAAPAADQQTSASNQQTSASNQQTSAANKTGT